MEVLTAVEKARRRELTRDTQSALILHSPDEAGLLNSSSLKRGAASRKEERRWRQLARRDRFGF